MAFLNNFHCRMFYDLPQISRAKVATTLNFFKTCFFEFWGFTNCNLRSIQTPRQIKVICMNKFVYKFQLIADFDRRDGVVVRASAL